MKANHKAQHECVQNPSVERARDSRLRTCAIDADGHGPRQVSEVYSRALERAARIFGSERELALRLKVRPTCVAAWIQGLESPPLRIFLEAVDVITDYDISQLSRSPAGFHGFPERDITFL